MPTSVTFCHTDPHHPLRDPLQAALETGTSLDAAVAYVTRRGVDIFLGAVRRLGRDQCRLSVCVQHPTNLEALTDLSGQLRDHLGIYLGASTPHELSGGWRPKLHSKVVWVGGGAGQATVYVGSHNWTATALDGVNMEASVRLECRDDEQFARDVRQHLNGCFSRCVVFNPSDLAFYQSIQNQLYPGRPPLPGREPLPEFEAVPDNAVVIHAEDHRQDRTPTRLFLYLPLGPGLPHMWFNANLPSRVLLYLYEPGTMLDSRPPSSEPTLFAGSVTTFGQPDNPILSQYVNSQIADLNRPMVLDVPSGNIPTTPGNGQIHQALTVLDPQGQGPLPVYTHEGPRPGVRVEAVFEDVTAQAMVAGPRGDGGSQAPVVFKEATDQTMLAGALSQPVPGGLRHFYSGDSIEHDRFVYRVPRPRIRVEIRVPGMGFYRVEPQETVRGVLYRRLREVEVDVGPAETQYRYFYPVRFVFNPRREQLSLF